jgi:hypothetical protein
LRCYSWRRRPWSSRSGPRRAGLSRKTHRPRDRTRQDPITRGITSDTAKTLITGHKSITLVDSTASRSNRKLNASKPKRGAGRLPFLSSFAVSVAKERLSCCAVFTSDAHRMRGVISNCFALSPVESYASFRGSSSSRRRCTPVHTAIQVKSWESRKTTLWKRATSRTAIRATDRGRRTISPSGTG